MLFGHRRAPAKSVLLSLDRPTLVFVTVCTARRERWLACDEVHARLGEVWRQEDRWHVTSYLLMPDHLHFFAQPSALNIGFDEWVTAWKRRFGRMRPALPGGGWQSLSFHHRIRSYEDACKKLDYMQQNPVRAGLVARTEDWPYRGSIFEQEVWWW